MIIRENRVIDVAAWGQRADFYYQQLDALRLLAKMKVAFAVLVVQPDTYSISPRD
jgi:hypothetical protein